MTILTRVSATLLAATCLAGAAAAQTELTFWQHGAGNPWEPRIFGQIVEDFNASQSDWKVTLEQFPQASYNDSVTAAALAGELPDIIDLARSLGGGRVRGEASKYPEVLAEISDDQLRELGEQYISNTRIQRKTDAPFFIDKMPNNWIHAGLIHLILPNAKIIDARRHPLGCCFSGFKQHFARGQHFTYGLEDIGRYYSDYVELMAHFDAVMPGRVHRVIYETLVEHTESEVRRLLDYCGLDFDERCLRFYENDRAVRTASSEQVRQPIYRDGVDHWRHYEPWLGPLRQALGPVLDAYPAAPAFPNDGATGSDNVSNDTA